MVMMMVMVVMMRLLLLGLYLGALRGRSRWQRHRAAELPGDGER